MTFPELSASDDSSLSDGLLLEEGERGSLGIVVRAGLLLEDGDGGGGGALAEFTSEVIKWGVDI